VVPRSHAAIVDAQTSRSRAISNTDIPHASRAAFMQRPSETGEIGRGPPRQSWRRLAGEDG
jgi:hypothetical protein